MRYSKNVLLKTDITKPFFCEQVLLKEMVLKEIYLVKNNLARGSNCNLEMLEDMLYFIDECFKDLTYDLTESNADYKFRRLKEFKESVKYILYENQD